MDRDEATMMGADRAPGLLDDIDRANARLESLINTLEQKLHHVLKGPTPQDPEKRAEADTSLGNTLNGQHRMLDVLQEITDRIAL